jgi:hypothetical protein
MIERLTSYPRRIICLTEETTETLYLLGEQNVLSVCRLHRATAGIA